MHDDPPADLPSGLSPDAEDQVAPAASEFARSQLPLGDHATTERVCPFLRVVAEDGTPGPAIESPDPANRCVAIDEPVPSRFDSRSSSASRARMSIARATCAGRTGSWRPSSGWPRPGP